MYVFQFEDASYRIALSHPSRIDFASIIKSGEARKLYDGIYETRAEADAAVKRIKEILGGRRS